MINYRLNQSVVGPVERAEAAKNAASDQLAAVRWARLNASTYGLDTSRIALCGSSAGAMASLVAGTSGLYTDLLNRNSSHAGQPNSVDAVVEISGGTDVGFLDGTDPDICIIHGGADNVIPVINAQNIAQAAYAAGIPFDIKIIAGAPHHMARLPQHLPVICKFTRDFLISHFI